MADSKTKWLPLHVETASFPGGEYVGNYRICPSADMWVVTPGLRYYSSRAEAMVAVWQIYADIEKHKRNPRRPMGEIKALLIMFGGALAVLAWLAFAPAPLPQYTVVSGLAIGAYIFLKDVFSFRYGGK